MGLPEKNHVPIVSVDPFVHVLVRWGEAKVDGARLTKVTTEESVETVKKLFTKFWKGF